VSFDHKAYDFDWVAFWKRRPRPRPTASSLPDVWPATRFTKSAGSSRVGSAPISNGSQARATCVPVTNSEVATNVEPVGKRARELVREQLKPGPRPGAAIEAAAKAAEIRERTLIRAAGVLRVRPQRGQWWLPS
jgi:hypothetical protein